MVVASRGTSKHHMMWMECSSGNRSGASLVKEAGVRFDARELLAFEVEDFHGMIASAAVCALAEC